LKGTFAATFGLFPPIRVNRRLGRNRQRDWCEHEISAAVPSLQLAGGDPVARVDNRK